MRIFGESWELIFGLVLSGWDCACLLDYRTHSIARQMESDVSLM